MPVYRHIAVNEIGDITVVRFLDRAMLDTSNIEEIAEELFALVESVDHRKFLFTFSAVEFLSSAMLDKFILFDRAAKKQGKAFKLCSLKPEIEEVFVITRLNQMFQIYEEEADAIRTF